MIRPNATYLITGGLGGLGLTVARWLVRRGARHVVLVGRHAPSKEAAGALSMLRAAGAEVVVARADVAVPAQVAAVIARMRRSQPPLRGIVHAAGVLDDGILLHLDAARVRTVLAPKVQGAWSLHELTRDAPLDFFLLFSSAASVIGSPGQAHYAAANAFLDALAWSRRSQGLPALSIGWGPWAGVGLATRPDRSGRLALHGIPSLTRADGRRVLDDLILDPHATHVMVLPAPPSHWRDLPHQLARAPLLMELGASAVESAARSPQARAAKERVRERLLAADPMSRQRLLEAYLREQVASVLGLRAAQLGVQRPLSDMGIDSLMVLEMKTRLEHALGVVVSVEKFFEGASITSLAAQLIAKLDGAGTSVPSRPGLTQGAAPTIAPQATESEGQSA